MGTRKTLIKSQAGVKLQRIEHLAGHPLIIDMQRRGLID